MIDYRPLLPDELEYLRRSDQRILRRAAGEIYVRRAAADRTVAGVVVFGLLTLAVILFLSARRVDVAERAAAPPIAVCDHAAEQLAMARTYLARARPGDVDDALLVVAAIAPTLGYCRDDVAVTHALERAARGGERERALAMVDAVLRSQR